MLAAYLHEVCVHYWLYAPLSYATHVNLNFQLCPPGNWNEQTQRMDARLPLLADDPPGTVRAGPIPEFMYRPWAMWGLACFFSVATSGVFLAAAALLRYAGVGAPGAGAQPDAKRL